MVSLQEQDQSAIISKAFNRAWAVLINKHKTEPIPEFYKKDEMLIKEVILTAFLHSMQCIKEQTKAKLLWFFLLFWERVLTYIVTE